MNFDTLAAAIPLELLQLPEGADIGDVGNVLGLVASRYFVEDFDRLSFTSGIEHGISLTLGTHS